MFISTTFLLNESLSSGTWEVVLMVSPYFVYLWGELKELKKERNWKEALED